MTLTPEQIREARIKLAEWMGGEVRPSGAIWGGDAHGKFAFRGDGYGMADIHVFDPFTDANDDYAVLEAMRNGKVKVQQIIDALESGTSSNFCDTYRIGDYARAALKEIDNDT